MPLTIIIGNLGSGKTFITTFLTYFGKRQIWSNYTIKSKKYHKLEITDLFSLPDYILLLMDEGYAWLESRASGSALNEYLSSILYHSRKTFTDIYITTPDFSAIDKRFRKAFNYMIICGHRSNFKTDDFHFVFYDKDNKSYSDYTFQYKLAEKYFGLYDTYEKVDSHRKDALQFKLLKKYPLKLKAFVIRIVDSIKNDFNGSITHNSVKDKLLMKGIDLGYEPYVYVRLKSGKQ